MFIDNEAKMRVDLFQLIDSNKNPYYVGKLRFPGTLKFNTPGVSFMAFVHIKGSETLQIGPLDERAQSVQTRKSIYKPTGKVHIDVTPKPDRHNNIIYVGGAKTLASMDCWDGIFFTMFVSREGEEEIQISRLHREKQEDSDLILDLIPSKEPNHITGKLQFPGTIDWDRGIQFTVMLDRPGEEILQISPLEDDSLLKESPKIYIDDKVHVRMIKDNDKLIGAVKCPLVSSIDCTSGIFLDINLEKGKEEISLNRLKHYREYEYEVHDMNDDELQQTGS